MKTISFTKKSAIILTIISLLMITSCGQRFGITRYDRPQENAVIDIEEEGTAIIRSLYCDITIKELKDNSFLKIINNKEFQNNNSQKKMRVPKLHFFTVSIKNTTNYPIVLKSIQRTYDSDNDAILTAVDIKKQYKSPLYQGIDFETLLHPRRLSTDDFQNKKFEYARDTLRSQLSFISPGDTIMQIIAFKKLPLNVRNYAINFTISRRSLEKIIAFDMVRFEYRSSGKYFTETTKQENSLKQ
jgi:hypothetical protein